MTDVEVVFTCQLSMESGESPDLSINQLLMLSIFNLANIVSNV